MRGPSFFVLTALADGPLHGYGVIQEVERLSGGATKLRAGTLYAAFDRLSAAGLIEVASEEVVDGRLRRNYRLTAPGKAVLSVESHRRMAISKEALRRLRLSGGYDVSSIERRYRRWLNLYPKEYRARPGGCIPRRCSKPLQSTVGFPLPISSTSPGTGLGSDPVLSFDDCAREGCRDRSTSPPCSWPFSPRSI